MCFLILGQKFGDEMTLHGIHLRSEGKRWIRCWEEKYRKGSNDLKPIKKLRRVEGERLLHAGRTDRQFDRNTKRHR